MTSSLAIYVISLTSSHEGSNVSERSHTALISQTTSHVGTWYFRLFPLGCIVSCSSSHVSTDIQGCLKPKSTVKSKTNSWAWGLHWNVLDTPNVTSLKKTDVPSPSNYQLQTASWLGWDFVPTSLLCTGLCLAQTCEGHTQLSQSFSSHLWALTHWERNASLKSAVVLTALSIFLPHRSMNLERTSVIKTSHWGLSPSESPSLHAVQL